MPLDPDPTSQNCCQNYRQGLRHHLLGGESLNAATEYYRHALRGSHPSAEKYIQWIQNGVPVEAPIDLSGIKKDNCIEYIKELAKGAKPISPELERGGVLLSEYLAFIVAPMDYLGHTIRMFQDLLQVGSSYSELKSSIERTGIVHNVLGRSGIPKPAEVREITEEEDTGWLHIDKVDFKWGRPTISGSRSSPLPPLVTQSDVDTALWLAYFEGAEPVSPSFSLDRVDGTEMPPRLDKKTFKPAWLAATPFGQSMYLADWLMKSFTMGDGLPSLVHPHFSGACSNNWTQPAMMQAIASASGERRLPDGSDATSGRLEIVVKGTTLSLARFRKYIFFSVAQYRIEHIDVNIASSLIGEDEEGKEIHFRHDDPSTGPGARAALIGGNYDYISDLFPVFRRVRYILGLFSVFCRAKQDGVKIARNERRRVEELISSYKSIQKSEIPKVEYSPKPFHCGGCYCFGGVSAHATSTITKVQSKPFDDEPGRVNFVVTPSGFVSPVPEGAVGPQSPRAPGMIFTDGQGGHGMHQNVSEVWVMDANRNQGARTYYKNTNDQKLDPFTGKTVDRNNPWAHIYHDG